MSHVLCLWVGVSLSLSLSRSLALSLARARALSLRVSVCACVFLRVRVRVRMCMRARAGVCARVCVDACWADELPGKPFQVPFRFFNLPPQSSFCLLRNSKASPSHPSPPPPFACSVLPCPPSRFFWPAQGGREGWREGMEGRVGNDAALSPKL